MVKLLSTTKTSEVEIQSVEEAKEIQTMLSSHGIKVNIAEVTEEVKS